MRAVARSAWPLLDALPGVRRRVYPGDQRERPSDCPGASLDAPQNALLATRQLIDDLSMTMTADARTHLTWVRSAETPVDHAVTDDVMARGTASQGVYLGLCGVQFFSAPMTAGPGSVCASCRRFAVARASLQSVEQRMRAPRHRRRGLSRVFARLLAGVQASESPAVPGPRSAVASADATPPAGGPDRVHGGAGLTAVPGLAVSHPGRPWLGVRAGDGGGVCRRAGRSEQVRA
ncbi:hypothetical protein ATK36_5696 [Amycolatopsis sulphurea]|uniref:Uncharacterized protein n=1 Tax=Amycolatopsis sulphurea TaxID=76022 RepID=A0A2A9FIX0_9PSEU|nr:hypothetical protein ATK36_5696 [Amycolatopsis sulphurea]